MHEDFTWVVLSVPLIYMAAMVDLSKVNFEGDNVIMRCEIARGWARCHKNDE